MNKYFLTSLFFVLGIVLGISGTQYYNKKHSPQLNLQLMEDMPGDFSNIHIDDFYNDFFNDDFFRENQFHFKQMEKMRESMSKLFKESQKGYSANDIFDRWFEYKFGGRIGDIKQSEDKKFIYYKLYLPDGDKDDVSVEVQNGIVIVFARNERDEEVEREESVEKRSLKQTFERQFPVPSNTDWEKFDYKIEGEFLVIQFPKIKKSMTGSYDV